MVCGENIIQQLLDKNLINNISDIYELNFEDIASLKKNGKKFAQNLIDSINKSKENDLYRLITALGIRHVGGKASKVLARKYKTNGKERPLGIPTFEDRLIQQCIKQILEPICEAKFHPHNYGFRPLRSTKYAVSRMMTLAQVKQYFYCVDIDIKGFFDNIDHNKLIKQMWTLGIRDKRLLSIISKMLKAEIVGEGIPEKGTPQGGILSPLLSNIVMSIKNL